MLFVLLCNLFELFRSYKAKRALLRRLRSFMNITANDTSELLIHSVIILNDSNLLFSDAKVYINFIYASVFE